MTRSKNQWLLSQLQRHKSWDLQNQWHLHLLLIKISRAWIQKAKSRCRDGMSPDKLELCKSQAQYKVNGLSSPLWALESVSSWNILSEILALKPSTSPEKGILRLSIVGSVEPKLLPVLLLAYCLFDKSVHSKSDIIVITNCCYAVISPPVQFLSTES